jgi:hypothetical protein
LLNLILGTNTVERRVAALRVESWLSVAVITSQEETAGHPEQAENRW